MKIQDYRDYNVLDFVEEEFFRKWLFTEDTSLDFFWTAYANRYPEQKVKMDEARQLLLETHNFFHRQADKIDIPDLVYKEEISEELQQVKADRLSNHISQKFRYYKLAAACIVLLALGVTYGLFQVNLDPQIHLSLIHI